MSISQLSELIRSTIKIPSLPEVVLRIQSLTRNPDTGTKEIGEVIAQDPELAAKMLKIANSAFYGLRSPCLSAEHASSVLGMRVLKSIVSQVAIMDMFDGIESDGRFDVRDLWDHSIRTAHVCAFLHKKSTMPSEVEADELYMCGLLHDIGKMVLLTHHKSEYVNILVAADEQNIPSWSLEQQKLGYTHTDVGGVLGTHWALPDLLVNAITQHHAAVDTFIDQPVTVMVACADELGRCVAEQQWPAASAVFSKPVKTLLGLNDQAIQEIIEFTKGLTVEI
ncbi:MAG: putative nucleotidyltransferase with HDIG domain [Chlamydiales bacterium]|jgi:putative nucleotidyltransferase with HDIG domain